MTFVVSSSRKSDLRNFTGLLFSAFQGITVYEYINADEAIECVRTHRVTAVFIDGAWDAENSFRLLRTLRQTRSETPIYLYAENDSFEDDALWFDATGYLIQPTDAEELKAIVLPALSLH